MPLLPKPTISSIPTPPPADYRSFNSDAQLSPTEAALLMLMAAFADEPGEFSDAAAAAEAAEFNYTAPNFMVSRSGEAFGIPEGSEAPVPTDNGKGIQFGGGAGGNGLDDSVTSVRFMDPTHEFPGGYVNYGKLQQHGGWQTLNPYTGQSVDPSSPWWHISGDGGH